MESQKRGKGRPKHIEKGANHNFWMPDDLWESIPKTKEKSKTTFICEAITHKLESERLSQIEPESQLFINQIVELGAGKDSPLYEAIKSYVVKCEQDMALIRMSALAIKEKILQLSNNVNQ